MCSHSCKHCRRLVIKPELPLERREVPNTFAIVFDLGWHDVHTAAADGCVLLLQVLVGVMFEYKLWKPDVGMFDNEESDDSSRSEIVVFDCVPEDWDKISGSIATLAEKLTQSIGLENLKLYASVFEFQWGKLKKFQFQGFLDGTTPNFGTTSGFYQKRYFLVPEPGKRVFVRIVFNLIC